MKVLKELQLLTCVADYGTVWPEYDDVSVLTISRCAFKIEKKTIFFIFYLNRLLIQVSLMSSAGGLDS